MFFELMPLLACRTVLITVAKVDDKTLRVIVIPHGKANDNPALSTPLTFTGPPEELDAELGKHLAEYVQPHPQTASTPERQEPFVNQVLAQHALALLARLFRYGEISNHGGFINLATGATSVLRIDSQCWEHTRRANKLITSQRRRQEDIPYGRAN